MFARLLDWTAKAFVAGGGLATVLAVALYVYQEKLLYHPTMPGTPKKPAENPKHYRSPEEYNIPFVDVWITTADGVRLHAWLLLQPGARRSSPTILYFHGNAGNIGFRLPNARDMYMRCGCHILMLDYRGYGNSDGTPTEQGLMLDAEAALAALPEALLDGEGEGDADEAVGGGAHGPLQVLLFGRSLGGAVALGLAHSRQQQLLLQEEEEGAAEGAEGAAAGAGGEEAVVVGCILENTFLDISSMVDRVLPALRHFKQLVLRMDWPSRTRAATVRCPLLFVSGLRDELVPPAHMRQLYELATEASFRDWLAVPKGTHNDTYYRGGEAYYRKLCRFVDRACARRGHGAAGGGVAGEGAPALAEGHIPSMLEHEHLKHVVSSGAAACGTKKDANL
jgi:fermentation-respiration switch protein FrsA (DUF1100 family)